MPHVRTQVYLDPAQRKRLDSLAREQGCAMAELIRAALDAYLGATPIDLETALDQTFGAAPEMSVPDRSEWDRSHS